MQNSLLANSLLASPGLDCSFNINFHISNHIASDDNDHINRIHELSQIVLHDYFIEKEYRLQ